MTNILGAVVSLLVTNITEEFTPIHGSIPCPNSGNGTVTYAVACYGIVGRKDNEKIRTTTIKRVDTLSLSKNGEKFTAKTETVLTNWTVTITRIDQWVETATNAPVDLFSR